MSDLAERTQVVQPDRSRAKLLVSGMPKAGVTHFASTAPNPLFVASADSFDSLIPGTVAVKYQALSELRSLYPKLQDQVVGEAFDTLVLDRVEDIQALIKAEILAQKQIAELDPEGWGQLMEAFSKTIKAFLSLPMNVILTTHLELGDDYSYRLALVGAAKYRLPTWVSGSVRVVSRPWAADLHETTRRVVQTAGDDHNQILGCWFEVPRWVEADFRSLMLGKEATPDPSFTLGDDLTETILRMYQRHGLMPPLGVAKWALSRKREIFEGLLERQDADRSEVMTWLRSLDAYDGDVNPEELAVIMQRLRDVLGAVPVISEATEEEGAIVCTCGVTIAPESAEVSEMSKKKFGSALCVQCYRAKLNAS